MCVFVGIVEDLQSCWLQALSYLYKQSVFIYGRLEPNGLRGRELPFARSASSIGVMDCDMADR
jgi:hypothetical protein